MFFSFFMDSGTGPGIFTWSRPLFAPPAANWAFGDGLGGYVLATEHT